jgi:putative transposase
MKSKGFGFPRFKKKMRSFVFPALSKNFLGDEYLNFPQLGKIRIRKSREYPSGFEPKQARIIQKASGFYVLVSFQSTELVPDMTVGKTCLGIDAVIESFVATSRGDLIKAPRFLLKVQSKLIAFPKLVRYTYFSSLLPLAFCLLPKTHNFCTSAD